MADIEWINPIESRMSIEIGNLVRPILSYRDFYYKQGPYRKERKEYTVSLMRLEDGHFYFLTGFIPKITNHLKKRGIDFTTDYFPDSIPTNSPSLGGIILESAQRDLIKAMLTSQRGYIEAPTGTGKTIMGLGALSGIGKTNPHLWLCHTKDLMLQTGKVAERFGFDVGYVGDGKTQLEQDLTIATRQSFIKVTEPRKFTSVIIDETHHLTTFNGEYARILDRLYETPIRLGLTATPPPDGTKQSFVLEGYLGPLIERKTMDEWIDTGLLSTARVRVLKSPINHGLKDRRKYADVYREGVVENIPKNSMIARKAKEHIQKGDSVLIMVTQITHGELLERLLKSIDVPCKFIYSITEGNAREEVKQALNLKHLKCVISSTIWREGVNIPELNIIINAGGGKTEIPVLQAVGRGLRRTPTKTHLIVYDVFDESHYYLISHFGNRMAIYSEMGWL